MTTNWKQILVLTLFLQMIVDPTFSQVKVTKLDQYLFPEFTTGTVLMKSGVRSEFELNYNTVTEEMLFEDRGQTLAIGYTEQLLIDTIIIQDRRFVLLNNKFVELLYQSNYVLFAENNCRILDRGKPTAFGGTSQTSAASAWGTIKSSGGIHELNLPEYYELKPYSEYWLRKNGILKKFSNFNELFKLNSGKKGAIRKFIKENSIEFEDRNDIVKLIKYLEGRN